jgi:membrane fusion protein, multidrug efflux system
VKRGTLVAGVLAVALVAGGGWWFRQRAAAPPVVPAAAETVAPVLEFAAADIFTVAPARLSRTVPLTGTLRPVNQTIVKTKVAGELRDLVVREGMSVKRGQVLGRIDTAEYLVRVRERDAQLQAVESQVDQARRTLENTRQLHERSFVSQNALDQARSGFEIAVGNRDAVSAQLALARKSLADAALVAPIDGIVAERFAQPGEKLAIDGRVLSIVDLSRMEIEAPVPAAEVGTVRIGQPVDLRVEGVAARQQGHVVRIAPSTQAGTRSVPIYIALDNRDPSVRAGLFAQGSLEVEARDGVLAVPLSAIRDAGARLFVYAVVDGRLVERDVRTGLRDESGGGPGRIEVVSGLAAGERIVSTNLGSLRPGATVRIAPAAGGVDASVDAGAALPAAAPAPRPATAAPR